MSSSTGLIAVKKRKEGKKEGQWWTCLNCEEENIIHKKSSYKVIIRLEIDLETKKKNIPYHSSECVLPLSFTT